MPPPPQHLPQQAPPPSTASELAVRKHQHCYHYKINALLADFSIGWMASFPTRRKSLTRCCGSAQTKQYRRVCVLDRTAYALCGEGRTAATCSRCWAQPSANVEAPVSSVYLIRSRFYCRSATHKGKCEPLINTDNTGETKGGNRRRIAAASRMRNI
jgi:hypothetical protein